jgi:GT2 family glycosyltransferase
MKCAVILLNWNAAEQTAETVRALRRWHRLKPDVCLVDNGSTDADHAALLALCPGERILTNPRNLGYAGGLNTALAVLRPEGYDAFFFLNTDARLPEEDAERLLSRLAENPHLGIVGPVLTEYRGHQVRVDAGGRNIAFHLDTRRRVPHPFPSVSPFDPSIRYCAYVPGTAILIHNRIFEAIGELDEAYFFSGEIADFCARANKAGFGCAVLPAARAEHDAGNSPLRSTLYLYYSLRNRFLYIRKFYPRTTVPLNLYWILLGLFLATVSLLTGRIGRLRAIGLAMRDGLTGRFGSHHEYFTSP